jgi:tRNA(Ile)-lysidine synthase
MTSTRSPDPLTAAVTAARDRVGPGLYGVACSGGADSLALAHALITVAGASHVVVVTIDHGLAPRSAEVAAEVARWAIGQGAASVVRRVVVEDRASLEAAARTARYAALSAIATELGLACVMLGHTARDQAETVLMRIIRGTGPAGLAGIPAQRGLFVRPLLALPREAIDAYAAEHALPVWADPMNDDVQLTRVRFRHSVLPALRHENPQLDAALLRLASSAGEWLAVIDAGAAPFARFPIACDQLAAQPAAIRKRAVSLALEAAQVDYDAVHLDRIDALVTRRTQGELVLDLPAARITRSYDTLDLGVAGGVSAGDLVVPEGPYQLRVWQAGDRMRPARLKGRSRKLSDLYIDAKVPRDLRASARVLVRTTDGSIVWAEHLGLAFGTAENLRPLPP